MCIRDRPHIIQDMTIISLIGMRIQPIFYNFDTTVTKELFMVTIENIELRVGAFVLQHGTFNKKSDNRFEYLVG